MALPWKWQAAMVWVGSHTLLDNAGSQQVLHPGMRWVVAIGLIASLVVGLVVALALTSWLTLPLFMSFLLSGAVRITAMVSFMLMVRGKGGVRDTCARWFGARSACGLPLGLLLSGSTLLLVGVSSGIDVQALWQWRATVAICVIVPVTEEVLYRGVLCDMLLKEVRLSPFTGIAISACVFGLMHVRWGHEWRAADIGPVLGACAIGLGLGAVYWMGRGSLWLAVGMHCGLNATAAMTPCVSGAVSRGTAVITQYGFLLGLGVAVLVVHGLAACSLREGEVRGRTQVVK